MRLSEHFELHEFTDSNTADIRQIPNVPDATAIEHLRILSEKVLEPVRAHFKRPVRISSGFRCPALNVAVGGSRTSQHVEGRAADIEVEDVSCVIVFDYIARNLDFDQVINETHDGHRWVHVSYVSPERNRKMVGVIEVVNGQKTERWQGGAA